MPKPNKVAKIVALGQAYDYWTSILIEWQYDIGVSFMTFRLRRDRQHSERLGQFKAHAI
jgi:hypothetical protein